MKKKDIRRNTSAKDDIYCMHWEKHGGATALLVARQFIYWMLLVYEKVASSAQSYKY